MITISVVVNTFNEEKNLKRCLESVKGFADEVVIVDMHSTDKTTEIAKKYTDKIFQHEYTRYVEPARNFALQQARGDWILLLDADEELSPTLRDQLLAVVKKKEADFVEIPRMNIIFNKWLEHSRWWPDYLTRFFKNNKVKFSSKIHQPPVKEGKGISLEAVKENAIIHHNFGSVSQYIERLNRYTDIQSNELMAEGYKLNWKDLMTKPANEFFSRFFAGNGYKDGLHGLSMALLQSFSELVLYLKVWEAEGFGEKKIENFDKVSVNIFNDLLYWLQKYPSNFLDKIRFKIKSKI